MHWRARTRGCPQDPMESLGQLSRRWATALACVAILASVSACSDDDQLAQEEGDSAIQTGSDAKDDGLGGDVAVADSVQADLGGVTTKTDALGPFAEQCAKFPSLCEDGNPCTVDGCDAVAGCTTTVKSCADEDPCSVDSCDVKTGDCLHASDVCDDSNACTVGACLPGEGCTYSAIDCQDGDNCTADGCTPAAGCQHDALSCDDGKTCTQDACDPAKGCSHQLPDGAQCCEIANDCEDGNPCTVHKCDVGFCKTEPVYGCCKTAGDCDDGNACTVDSCAAANGTCTYTAKVGAGCCASALDCDDGNACTVEFCQNNACGHEATCCKVAADCAAALVGVDLCAEATCSAAGCAISAKMASSNAPVAGCCSPSVQQTGFEPTDTWIPTLVPSQFAAFAIAQGFGKAGAALRFSASPAGQPVPGGKAIAQARFPAVQLPVGLDSKLTFAYKGSLGSGDQVRVLATTSIGSWWIWQGGNTGSSWVTGVVDLTGFGSRAATRSVKLSVEVLGGKGSAAGWAIDDWQVTSTCKQRKCSGDGPGAAAQCNDSLGATADSCGNGLCTYSTSKEYCIPGEPSALCNDDNACTNDYCSSFGCAHTKKANCCLQQAECDDKDVCTTDTCTNNLCQHPKLPGTQCCNKVSDCDDGKVCTLDTCPEVGLACAHTAVGDNCCDVAADCEDASACTIDTCSKNKCAHKNTCCTKDAECDDGDPVCTADTCVNGKCSWTALKKPECCEPALYVNDLENSAIPGLNLASTANDVKWQWVGSKKSKSGTGALYYGNPAKGNFDNGSTHSGTVGIAAPLAVAKGESLVLSFWLYMDTESGGFDTLDVEVVGNGKAPVAVWQKESLAFDALPMKTWTLVKVDLSSFGGEAITVQLRFDTVDSVANTTEGVYVDDLAVTRGCGPKACTKDADCDDKWTMTTEKCSASTCTWTKP